MPPNEFSPNVKEWQGQNAVVMHALIREYSLHMCRVDHVNQQLHSVSPLRKMCKWYKKLAIRIIMPIVLNAQIIYVITTSQKMTSLQFIKNVVLIWVRIPEGPPENMPPDETVIRLTSRHFPSMPLPNQGGKNQSSVNRCQLCYANGNRSAIEEAVSELNMCTISVLQHQVCILTNVLKFIIAKRTMDLMMNSFFIIVWNIFLFTLIHSWYLDNDSIFFVY